MLNKLNIMKPGSPRRGQRRSQGNHILNKLNVMLSMAILILFSMLLLIVFAENGLIDLQSLRKERDRLVEKNESLARDNLVLYNEIERLKNDDKYIENIARRELGMIGKNEVILKPQSVSGKRLKLE
ncbi:MAG: septum formation initiator family protein [Deltaproteobacteria bacterium]|nr:septum formation initiator family protein [Deltaproteobacteria bacterium]